MTNLDEFIPHPETESPEEMAKKLYKQEEILVEMIEKYLGEGDVKQSHRFLIQKNHDGLFFSSKEPLTFTKLKPVLFNYDKDIRTRFMQNFLKIDTPYSLFAGTHEDEDTRDKIEEMSELGISSLTFLLGSYYFFTNEGKYAKVVSLPSNIIDKRPVITYAGGRKYVEGKMKPEEFYGAHSILSLIRDHLKE